MESAMSHGEFDRRNILVSRTNANTNLRRGSSHWHFKNWNPEFGDISRYTLNRRIGIGQYSEVFLGKQDGKTDCAIKILKPIVNADRIRREMKILHLLRDCKNVIELFDIVIDGRNGIPSLVTRYYPQQNYKLLFMKFDLDGIRKYMFYMLKGLKNAHKRGIMHRDIKPANILCENVNNGVYIADWGLAEFYHPAHKYSTHVGTRFYKPPELLIEYGFYNYSVDIWAAGVSFLEALTGKIHIFETYNAHEHMEMIAKIVGGKKIIEWIDKYSIEISEYQKQKLGSIKEQGLSAYFNVARRKFMDNNALDLVMKLLEVDHKIRISASEALKHPFFSSLN